MNRYKEKLQQLGKQIDEDLSNQQEVLKHYAKQLRSLQRMAHNAASIDGSTFKDADVVRACLEINVYSVHCE